jgi:hypothetical protein
MSKTFYECKKVKITSQKLFTIVKNLHLQGPFHTGVCKLKLESVINPVM